MGSGPKGSLGNATPLRGGGGHGVGTNPFAGPTDGAKGLFIIKIG
jgi:hypothetical protein